jgi:hypothetical protein
VRRIARSGQTHADRLEDGQFFKRMALPLPVFKVRQRRWLSIAMVLRFGDDHHMIQLWHREGAQHHGVRNAERRCICADADR